MKIAHVISTFPPRVGGMGEVCYEEAKQLTSAGHDVAVFTMRYEVEDPPLPPLDKVRITGAGVLGVTRLKPWLRQGDGGWLPQLFFKLKNFDIIHLHFPFYVSAHCVLLAKWFRKQKYVVTYHMDAQSNDLGKKIIQRIYDFIFAKLIFKNAEKIIVVDKEYFKKSCFNKYVTEDKLIEIHNGVNIEIFRPLHVETQDFASLQKTILFVGNPLPVKRLDLLLQALKIIDDKNARLLVVGDGYAIEKYKKMAKELELENRVKFVGACVEKNKLAQYYNSSWCTAIPSASESFSLVALESLACGCPVIASNIPGINGRIMDRVDGWLVNDSSAQEWANVLNRVLLLSVERRKEMGEAGRKKILAEYGWDKHIKNLLEVYRVINA